MTGDHFEDDETRPVQAPPVYKPDGADMTDTAGTAAGARERRVPGPRPGPKGPPAYDAFDDDVTIMVDRAATTSGGMPVAPAAGSAPDVRSNPIILREPSTVGSDALARRSEEALGAPPPGRPAAANSQSAWKPPARPSAPGVNSLEVRKQRSVVLFAFLAVVVALGVFFVLLWLLGDG